MKLTILFLLCLCVSSSLAQSECKITPLSAPTVIQVNNYVTKSIECSDTIWRKFLKNGYYVMSDLIQKALFFQNYGNQLYADFFSSYSFLSLASMKTAYNTYVNGIKSKTNSLIILFNNLAPILNAADTNYLDLSTQVIVYISQLNLLLNEGIIQENLLQPECDQLVAQKVFDASDAIISGIVKCSSQNIDYSALNLELSNAVANWYTLYNQFKICVDGVTSATTAANTCITNTVKQFAANSALILKSIATVTTMATDMGNVLPLQITDCLRKIQYTIDSETDNLKSIITDCLGVAPVKMIEKSNKTRSAPSRMKNIITGTVIKNQSIKKD